MPVLPQPSLPAAPGGGAQLREQAYADIKRRIIACELAPGAQINEGALGTLLGLGRTPIHQALHRLEMEGLVTILPRKGIVVAPLSLDEVLDMIEVRACNETLCVRLAAERVRPAELAAMRHLLDEAPALLAAHDVPALMALDLRFHSAISAAARNTVLADLLRRLHEQQARFWFLTLSEAGHSVRIHDEHQDILAALERHDPDAGAAAMQRHIDDFRRAITRAL
ncbi:GntR family transcriptional regulator [Acidovorax sp. SUPP2522]|uniref:GntR family transcriptional regulator n=1 Tax=unclassified Acidovorax TaxID=2684926 RepID=UPI002349343B|nr:MULTISPECIES: GntR family transcriptional regulator [unclassified Acidovorax]WCM98582.1 GntR family transcriptional regulator [Acidovorax sp. GBBC 1281]GKT17946.1 GntR family transcriptional regulator [Acidovorax sp. SUPP2522]